MLLIAKLVLATNLIPWTTASPLAARANAVVQGSLGSDEYWNDYDGGLNHYTMYSGNGSISAGWPSALSWVSFNSLWVTSQHVIARSCDILYKTPNNSDQETTALYEAIKQVAHETRVDHRFILACIMQETRGCVRAMTSVSEDGIRNPGVLQSFKGEHSCNEDGKVKSPCPAETILGMVRDGVIGTDDGNSFTANINAQTEITGMQYAEAYYRAARLYNSGAIDDSGDLGKGSATHCYASDIANRLMGWVDATSNCTLDKNE